MSHITLKYVLSEEAQRAELAAGRPAHREREFQLEPTVELAKEAIIDAEGNATIKSLCTKFDASSGEVSHWGSESVQHEANHVLSDQNQALAFLHTCDTAVRAKRLNILADKEERERLRVKYNAERAEAEAKTKAERLEKEARESEARRRFETEVQDWAAEHSASPELKRAARERRAVVSEVRQQAKERVIAAVTEIVSTIGFVVETYESQPREGVPSREAYALLDLLKSSLLSIADASGLPKAEAKISDILRHDVAPQGSAVWRTGVTVSVDHPWLANAIEVDVTSEAPPEEEIEED